MEQTALISVIVPVYKVEEYLPKCVESILNQTYSRLEVILVDDGSPDGCGRLCDAYAARDSRVRVIHKPNGGLSDARNAGIEIATGAYLAFVDSDDWLEPDAYEAMLSAAVRHNAALVCAGRYDENELTGVRAVGLCPEREEMVPGVQLVRRIFHWNHLDSAAWDKLYARALFHEIRYPVGRIVEDVPTTYRLVLLAGGGLLLPKPIYHYRRRADSITTARVSDKSTHAMEHAALVYADIQKNYPELEPDARYLLVTQQWSYVKRVDLSDRETRKKYAGECRRARRGLRENLSLACRSHDLSAADKFFFVLCALGLYGPVFNTYHFLQGLKRKV